MNSDHDSVQLFADVQSRVRHVLDLERLVARTDDRVLFVAVDRVLKRREALRVHLKAGSRSRLWFERETELLASLDHPSIRPVYSAGLLGDWAYRASKWVDGESLAEATARGPRPLPSVLRLARDLTGALDFAHTQRVILRRILPATVMLDRRGTAVVTDLRYANQCLDVAAPDDDPTRLVFLAPETRDGQPGDPSSDIYTTGALLYFALTGQSPAANPADIVPPTQLRPACPKVVERVIMRALAAEPRARYLTAVEMAEDLVSDLGDYPMPSGVTPQLGIGTEDSRTWEKRLRRALGDDYELLSELGSGGFGRVYLVRDQDLEREVALKVLHPFLTADAGVVERFRKEAQLAARLGHPNIVSIYGIGGRAGLLWYTMEYIRGMSLAKLIETEGPAPVDQIVRVLQQSLHALRHAHAGGLVHRDVKPENILIDGEDGSVHIADFGLALALQGAGRFGGASSRSGTPEFAAPEQLLGGGVDARADLYSLSLVGFFALLGRSPYASGTVEAIAAQKAVGRLPDVAETRDDVPEELNEILLRGAALRPEDRFSSADEYLDALRPLVRRGRETPVPWLRRVFGG